jgi:hypothetical protein
MNPQQSEPVQPGTNLVPIEVSKDQLPATQEEFVMDSTLDASDIVLPALKLLQGQSPEVLEGNGRPGNFWDSLQGLQIAPPVRCVIAWHGKARFKPEGRPAGTDMCVSSDTVAGTRYGSCKDCDFKEWGSDDGGKRKPPACSLDQLFVLLTDSGLLAVHFRKKAEKYAKQFITQRTMSGKNWWAYNCMLRVKQEAGTDAQGKPTKYFAPTITWLLAEPTSEPLRLKARQLHEGIQKAADAGRLSTAGEDEESEA